MKNKKLMFPIISLTASIIILITIALATNIIIINNVTTNAKVALGEEQFHFSSFTQQTEVEGYIEAEEYVNREFPFKNYIIVDGSNENSYNPFDEELVNYVNYGTYEKDVIHQLEINGDDILVVVLEGLIPVILYMELSDYLYLLDTLNITFGIIGTILVVLITFMAYRIGKHYDESENKIKRFFNNASHELKTPLTSIQGYAETIRMGIADNDSETATKIIEKCEATEALVEELLLLSKLDSNALKPNLVEVSIYEILDRLVTFSSSTAQKHNIRISCAFDENDAIVECDEKHLYNAFNAVISNSIRYAKSQVIIEGRQNDEEIVVLIKDDGEGIIDEIPARVFERFYTGKDGKSGIGLSLAKEIIQMNMGNIYVYNHNGAVFKIVFKTTQTSKPH